MKVHYSNTPNPRKTCTVITYLDIRTEFVKIDLTKGEHMQPEFLAINPNGKPWRMERKTVGK